MTSRLHGNPLGFWDGTTLYNSSTNPGGGSTVGAGQASKAVNIARGNDQIVFYINVSAATTVTVEVAHRGFFTAEGNDPDESTPPANFYPLYYINSGSQVQFIFAGAGTAAVELPDVSFQWVRLRTSGALATVSAGWEAIGE